MAYESRGACINCGRCSAVCPVGASNSNGLGYYVLSAAVKLATE